MQRDYILRMIEQAGTILKHLLQRIQAEPVSLEERTDELKRAASLGGLDLDMLRLSDMDGLWHQVALTGEADPARTWLAAETLYSDAVALEIDGDIDAAVQSYVKAASLFRMMEPNWVLPTGFPEATERVEFGAPRLPVFSSVTGALVRDGAHARDLLRRQLAGPVRWVDVLDAAASYGVDGYLEVGPGRVLSGFAKRTVPDAQVRSTNDARRITTLLRDLRQDAAASAVAA